MSKLRSKASKDPANLAGSHTGGTYQLSGSLTTNATYANTIIASNGVNAAPYTISSGTGITQPWFSNSLTPKIQLNGEGADIEINGKSLVKVLEQIEKRLNILITNPKLEAEWEELRELGNRYRELEQHIKDKQATWDRLTAT